MEISSISPYGATQDYSALGLRSQYLGALSIALRSGDTLSAQEALLGYVGTGGVLSPASLYGQVKQSIEAGDKPQMIQHSNTIASYHKSGLGVGNTPSSAGADNSNTSLFNNAVSQNESALPIPNGIGSLVNAAA